MRVVELRDRLSKLREKETIARTRQQLLDEEKVGLLKDVRELLSSIEKLNIVPVAELTPQNLSNVIKKVRDHISAEIEKTVIPEELS